MAVPTRIRPLARIVFAVALFGILVVTHLGLQVQKGFSNGCAGFGGVDLTAVGAAPEASGCASVATGEYADFLGVSNIVWGLLFYVLVAGLRLAYGATGDDRFRKASLGVVGAGFLYTLYLVYLQAVVIQSFCVLCMTSAATVTALLALHLWENARLTSGERHSAPPPSRVAALRPYLAVVGVFAVLLVADVALAGGDAAPEGTPEAAALASGAEAPADAPVSLAPPLPVGCAYDPQFAPVGDLSTFMTNPSKGSGPVTVVEIFDPNCSHCRALHEAMRPVIDANLESATFYAVPFPLRQPTVGQAAALVWAQEQGRFFELMEEFFARQDATWGMTGDEIRDSANAAGLDGPSLMATLEDQSQLTPILERVQANATAVQTALASPTGGLSVPKLLINGRVVAPTDESYSTRCLNQFIADAAPLRSSEPAVVEEIQ